MQSETTTAITAVKQDVRLREWAEQLEAQQANGIDTEQYLTELFSQPVETIILPLNT